MGKRLNIKAGDKFGKLTVIKEVDRLILPSGQKNRTFKCRCDCGNESIVRLVHLKRGRIKSCGCLHKTANGMSKDKIYILWRTIKYRCSKNYFESHLYYDKGIKVCDLWANSFEQFRKWCINNNYKVGLYIDRIDSNSGYEPSNCRFVNAKVSSNNTSSNIYVDYKNKKIAIQLLIDKLGEGHRSQNIVNRYKRGWDIMRAIKTPTRKGNYKRKENK